MKWDDLVDLAFLDLAVIQPGEPISLAMRTDARTRLNTILSSLSTEGLIAFNQVKQAFNLQQGIAAYTLGVGGSFNTSKRAQKVTSWRASYANVLHTGGPVLSLEAFGAQAQQQFGETTSIPKSVGADTAYPLINVRVFPPPSAAPGQIELAYWTAVDQVSDFTADISGLPDGWPEMLHWALAVELYPQYARATNTTAEFVAGNAQRTKQVIMEQHSQGAAAPEKQ